MVIGATIGMFDGVHKGHRYLISQLKEHCDEAVVVTFENHPRWVVTGKREPQLLTTAEEKTRLLSELGVRPIVMRFDERMRRLTAQEFVEKLSREAGVTRLVLGFNNSIGSDRLGATEDEKLKASTGVEIVRASELPGEETVNSSKIRALLSEGEVEAAARLLTRAYTIEGKVGHGKALGRTIGYPTANIEVGSADKLLPQIGVYAADVATESGDIYRGVVNIGRRPTVASGDAPVTIEAYIDGFSGDLYGTRLRVAFLRKLRGEMKFADLTQLQSAIAQDVKTAREV